jgi:DNA polymerase-3 subunit gamma/tau
MAAAAGCPSDILLYAAPSRREEVSELGRRLGLQNTLAAMQILDQTLSRLRYSTQGRILAELAVVRICCLEDLTDLADLIAGLRSGSPNLAGSPPRPRTASPSQPPSPVPARVPAPRAPVQEPGVPGPDEGPANSGESASPEPESGKSPEMDLTESNVTEVWSRAVGRLEGMAADPAKQFAHVRLPEANRILVTFKAGGAFNKTICEQPGNLADFENALKQLVGRHVRVSFEVEDGPAVSRDKKPAAQVVSPHQRLMEVTKHPMIRRAGELFGATPTEVIDPADRLESSGSRTKKGSSS